MTGNAIGSKVRVRSSRRLVTVAAAMAVVAAACSGSGSSSAPTSTAPAKVAKGGTITVVGAYDPTTLNPKSTKAVSTVVMSSVWRGVSRLRPDFQFELNADLVTSAEMVSSDPQTIVYKINAKATWSDGVPVDADDFIYNWQTTRPGATDVDGSPIQSNVGTSGPDPIASVTGSDGGKTVTVVWKQPNIEWKSGSMFNILVPAHIARRVGFNSGFNKFDPAIDVSDSPYKVGSYNPGSDVTLVRNEHYWGAPANLDSIVFRVTTEDAAVGAFRNGEGDEVNGHALPDVVAQLQALPGVTTNVYSSLTQETLLFNERNDLLAIPAVRKAIALALDRPGINQRVVPRGWTVGVVDSFTLANNQPGYHDTSGGAYDHQDLAGAKRLLEGAGFVLGPDGVYAKDGKRLSLRIRAAAEAPHDQESELVQAQLKPAGIEVQIANSPVGVIGPQIRNGDFDLGITGIGKNVFGTLNLAPGSLLASATAYANAQFDQLMQQAHGELDDNKRRALVDQGDRMLWGDLPMVPIYQWPSVVAVRSAFENVAPNPAGGFGEFWNLEQWGRRAGK